MEKNRILDACGKTLTVWTVCVALLLPGCAMPRIIVLKDTLTPEEHLNLGVSYEENKEFDAAIREYRIASKQLPVADVYMGNVHFAKGEYEQAEACYRKAIQEDPRNADARNNLAWLYYIRDVNLKEAEELAEEAVELDPAKADIYRDTLDHIHSRR